MKDFFESVSFKTKNIFAISFLIISFVSIYNSYISSSAVNSSKIFKILIFSEALVILLMSKMMHKLIKSDSSYSGVISINKDEISDGSMIFNTISEGIIVTDNKGRIRSINQGLCRILGIEENQIISKNVYSLLSELNYNDASKALLLMVIESLETQKEYRQKEEMFVINAEPRYLAVSTYMLRSKNKNTIGVLAVVHDFTQENAGRAFDAC